MKPALFFLSFLSVLFVRAQNGVDVQQYHFEIELSDASDAITGKALIRVLFNEETPVLRLDLASLEEDKGMVAFSVTEEEQVLRTTHAQDVLTVFLARPAVKGDVRNFTIQYMGTPKDGLIIARNRHGERTFFADNWPDRAHHWIPCRDRPDDKAPVEFVVTAPSAYSIISNGVLTEEVTMAGNRKRTTYREQQPLSTKIMVIGAARFAVKVYPDSPKALPVSAWVYPQDSTKGFYDYGLAPSIVRFFSGYIGPFPFLKLANVQSKTMFGGMENAGAIFYPEESVTGNRGSEATIAHEIVHQWFGDMATEKSFAHLWLSEGFATYLTDLYFEMTYGAEKAAERLRKERSEVIAFVQGSNHPVVDSSRDYMSLLNANSYQKGAWVLHMLRKEVGDSVFRKIIQTYYKNFAGRNADSKDFETTAETVSGKELTSFFDQWLYRPGIPELAFHFSKGVLTVLQQQKQSFVFSLPLRFLDENDRVLTTQLVRISDRLTKVEVPAGARSAQIDPDTVLLYKGVFEVRFSR